MSYRPILLVEDNPDDESLTVRVFAKSKILNPVAVAHDGAEALEMLFGDGGTGESLPALVLLDLKLPKVDGFEVLARIRASERTRLIPVVILTSSAHEEDVLAGYQGGANAYVRKPVNFTDFAEAVRTLGVFWVLTSELPPDVGSSSANAAPAAPRGA